ncbi:MAG: hypothetical protein IPQ07_17605 [Myxococcales bacterium]|nr:hypothetical protein [Myxococcales bacterium]
MFSEDDYLAANPDLAAMTPGELRAHWLAHGMREGRAALRSFHVKEYLELYPSVHAAFAAEPNAYRLAIDHYLDVGRQRGWVGRYELAPAFFNVDDYRALNGRTTALMSRDRAIEHVLTSGQRNHLRPRPPPRLLHRHRRRRISVLLRGWHQRVHVPERRRAAGEPQALR